MTQMKVELIDNMGNDLSVIRAAAASFAKDPVEWDEEKHPRLINYLARGMTQADFYKMVTSLARDGYLYADNGGNSVTYGRIKDTLEQYRHTPLHFSPFTHTAITLRLKAPIAIHAQMMKHTVGFAHNTVSRRYVSDTPELFVPEFREAPKGNVKQGSGDVFKHYGFENGDWYNQQDVQNLYKETCDRCIDHYLFLINELHIAPEQARFVLPQGVMTEWISTGSLYAWARFYNQRTDPHAQKEIQDLATMVGEIIEPLYPVSWQALTRQSETNNG